MSTSNRLSILPTSSFCRALFFSLVLLAVPCLAEADVTARFQSANSTLLSLEVRITEPAPNNLIVSIEVPNAVRIKATTPPTRKIEGDGTRAKWLLKRSTQGVYLFSVSTDKPARNGVHGQVQFNDPQSRAIRIIDASF